MFNFVIAGASTLGEAMKQAVRPDDINFLGLNVNPSFFSALIVTVFLLSVALLLRVFVIPRFKIVPTKFQAAIEWIISFFADIAKQNSPHRPQYVGPYNFSAGMFVFFGTMIELVGLRAILVDVNACIAIALCSFGYILFGSVRVNSLKGALSVAKDFSLPLSMTFRLFGSMLSGLLVTELVYEYIALSFVLPVIVGLLFTVFHALMQTYILATITSMFYGEATERKQKNKKIKKIAKTADTTAV